MADVRSNLTLHFAASAQDFNPVVNGMIKTLRDFTLEEEDVKNKISETSKEITRLKKAFSEYQKLMDSGKATDTDRSNMFALGLDLEEQLEKRSQLRASYNEIHTLSKVLQQDIFDENKKYRQKNELLQKEKELVQKQIEDTYALHEAETKKAIDKSINAGFEQREAEIKQLEKEIDAYSELVAAEERANDEAFNKHIIEQKKALLEEEEAARKAADGFDDLEKSTQKNTAAVKHFVLNALSIASVMEVVHLLKRAFSEVYEQVKVLDSVITDLAKVSNLDSFGLKAVSSEAYEMGERVGRTGANMVQLIAEMKRSGYELKDALNLAEQAAIMQNVGDNITDPSAAAQNLSAILKGFDKEASGAEEVLDILNNISNNKGVSFDNLVDGATRFSAIAKQNNMSLAEMSGELTAGFEILQNMEKTATGLNQIYSRMRNVKLDTDTDEMADLPKLTQTILDNTNGLVTNIDKVTGELRDNHDVLKDLAGVWDSLSRSQQDQLGLTIAGSRQMSVFFALMQNWVAVEDSIALSANATGSALQENARYLDSIEGKINTLQSAFQKLTTGTIDSKNIKEAITLVTGLVNTLSGLIKTVGPAPVIIGAATLALGTFNKNLQFVKISADGAKFGLSGLSVGLNTAAIKTAALTAASALLNGVLTMGVSVAITAVVSVIGNLITAQQRASDAARELTETSKIAAEKSADEAKTVKDLADEYKDLASKTDLTTEDKTRLDAIQEQLVRSYGLEKIAIDELNGSYDAQLEKLDKLTRAKAEEAERDARAALINAKDADEKFIANQRVSAGYNEPAAGFYYEQVNKTVSGPGGREEFVFSFDSAAESAESFKAILDKLDAAGYGNSKTWAEVNDKLKESKALSDAVAEAEKKHTLALENLEKAADSAAQVIENIPEVLTGVKKAFEETSKPLEDFLDQIKSLSEEYALLNAAQKEFEENGTLSAATLMKLYDSGIDVNSMISAQNGLINFNIDMYRQMQSAALDAQLAVLDLQKDELLAMDYAGAITDNALRDLTKRSALLIALRDSLNSPAGSKAAAKTASSAAEKTDNTDHWKAEYDKQLKDLKFNKDMELITEEEYYKQLEILNNKYFLNREKYLDDYRANLVALRNYDIKMFTEAEKVKQDAQKKTFDEYISQIDEIVNARKRLREDNNLALQIAEVDAELKYGRNDKLSEGELLRRRDELLTQTEDKTFADGIDLLKEKLQQSLDTNPDIIANISTADIDRLVNAISAAARNAAGVQVATAPDTTRITNNNQITLSANSMTEEQIAGLLERSLGTGGVK